MAAPIDPAVLANALQALTTALKIFQANPHVLPAASSPADHVNIMDAFESVNPFNLGSQARSYDYIKAIAPVDKTWDGTIGQFPSFIISLCVRESEVHWYYRTPQCILDIGGTP